MLRSVAAARRASSVLAASALLAGCSGDGSEWWTGAAPQDVGLPGAAFETWAEGLHSRGTAALIVLRNGKLVHEWYAAGRRPDQHHGTASLAKGLFGGLALALLLEDGRIRLDEPAATYIPSWRDDPDRSRITVRHLASHTSGLENPEEPGVPHDRLTGWKGVFWARDSVRTRVHLALEEAPLSFEPGSRVEYSNTGFAALAYVLAVALRDSGAEDLRIFLRDGLLRRAGVRDDAWSMGYREPFLVDGVRVWLIGGGGSVTPRALARVGLLLLARGDWNGEEVLSWNAIQQVVVPGPGTVQHSGENGAPLPLPAAGWWSNANSAWPALPRDAFFAAGAGHQVLLVVPSLDLVVVRMGEPLVPYESYGDPSWTGRYGEFFDSLHRLLLEPLGRVVPDSSRRPQGE